MSGSPDTTTLTEEQYDLLIFLEQYWWTNATLPTKAKLAELGMDTDLYTTALRSDLFKTALLDRGIDRKVFLEPGTVKSWKDSTLTEEQLTAANMMLDLKDNRSQRKKLMELGIPTQRWESWLRDPVFQGYLRERAENLLGDNQHEAHLALIDRVRAGELPAIKYFNELTGRYVPVSAAAVGGTFDTKMVLIRVVEILQIHLSDEPERLQAIASDLIALAEGPATSKAPSPVISRPTISRPTPAPFRAVQAIPKSIEGAL